MNDTEVYSDAAILGAISGLRSMAGPALVSQFAHSGMIPVKADSQLGFLTRPVTAQTTAVLAIGEMIADKLPAIPSRLEPGPLGARLVMGALSAGAYAFTRRRSAAVGAAIGAATALLAAFAGYHLRRATRETVGVPDAPLAIAEDAAVVALGSRFVRSIHLHREAV